MTLTPEERVELWRQALAGGTQGALDRYTDLVEAAVAMRLSGAEQASGYNSYSEFDPELGAQRPTYH